MGRAEYDLLVESGMRRWPARLAHQPIFYPVLNREYATQIAREWNTKDEVSGLLPGFSNFFPAKTMFSEQLKSRLSITKFLQDR